MPLAERRRPFDHPDWLFEVKYDGFRALAIWNAAPCAWSRAMGTCYKSFPALCQSLGACLSVSDAVLDDEIVYLGPDGKPQFADLMRRRGPQYFYAFDLPWLNGRDHHGLPLLEHKRRLREIVLAAPSPVLYVDHVVGTGVDLFEAGCWNDLVGIVAKHLGKCRNCL